MTTVETVKTADDAVEMDELLWNKAICRLTLVEV